MAVGLKRSLPVQTAAAQTVPSAMGEQVPSWPGTAHELHGEQAPEPQQNPSRQCPLMHSLLVVQVTPFAARFVHELPRQVKPGAQSVLVTQVVRQAFALQT